MYLLDTNVVFEFRKAAAGRGDINVAAWARVAPRDQLYISIITILELDIGVLRKQRRDPIQASIYREWLISHVFPIFQDRILMIDLAVVQAAAPLHVPDPRPDRDAFIAATAIVHNLTVVTRNIRYFKNTGVRLLNPWET
ncbi:type II toxin-antitoxin system VapC family toxin [Pararhizobium gei]|uniref:type II toxin-antitoxin system VapC family toxin n=1 Tax=Pararhizobium gei TaxID=1395951 RepID=UPI0030840B10